MAYILYKSNGKPLATIADGSINSSVSSLTFVGKNYAGYGEILNQNLVKLLENFANVSPPSNPSLGQLWYDTTNKLLTVYNGSKFKSLTSFNSGLIQPTTGVLGDFWFNQNEQKLYFYNGSNYVLVGPETSQFNGTTISAAVALGTDLNNHYVLNFTVTDDTGLSKIIAVASRDEFTPSPTDPLYDQKFHIIKQGLTLPTSDATNGNSISDANEGAYYFWGTAATAKALVYPTSDGAPAVVHPATDFFLYADWQNALATGLHVDNNYGLIIANGYFKFQYSGAPDYIGQVSNYFGSQIDFQVNVNSSTGTVLSVLGQSLVPADTYKFNLGSPSRTYANLYVSTVTSTRINFNSIVGTNITVGTTVGTTATFNTVSILNTLTSVNIGTPKILATIGEIGALTVTGDALVKGNLTVNVNETVQGNLTVQGITYTKDIQVQPGYSITGNIVGNVIGTNNTILATNMTVKSLTVTSTFVTPNLIAPGSSVLNPSGGSGDILGLWSLVAGSTLAATYSDLAERYHADTYYNYGTVLIVGGINEVTTTDVRADTRIAGVVSKAPAYMMNQDAGPDITHPYIALKGRIPCNVVGIIHKGDRLVTSERPGYAETFQNGDSPNAVIGIALEDSLHASGMIEIKV
jgi:hypothetical protein